MPMVRVSNGGTSYPDVIVVAEYNGTDYWIYDLKRSQFIKGSGTTQQTLNGYTAYRNGSNGGVMYKTSSARKAVKLAWGSTLTVTEFTTTANTWYGNSGCQVVLFYE